MDTSAFLWINAIVWTLFFILFPCNILWPFRSDNKGGYGKKIILRFIGGYSAPWWRCAWDWILGTVIVAVIGVKLMRVPEILDSNRQLDLVDMVLYFLGLSIHIIGMYVGYLGFEALTQKLKRRRTSESIINKILAIFLIVVAYLMWIGGRVWFFECLMGLKASFNIWVYIFFVPVAKMIWRGVVGVEMAVPIEEVPIEKMMNNREIKGAHVSRGRYIAIITFSLVIISFLFLMDNDERSRENDKENLAGARKEVCRLMKIISLKDEELGKLKLDQLNSRIIISLKDEELGKLKLDQSNSRIEHAEEIKKLEKKIEQLLLDAKSKEIDLAKAKDEYDKAIHEAKRQKEECQKLKEYCKNSGDIAHSACLSWKYNAVSPGFVEIVQIGISNKTGMSEWQELQIPARILGSKVIAIGNEVETSVTNIQSIVIPNGVEIIRRKAFYGFRDLKRIKIPKSVKTIEQYILPQRKFEAITIYTDKGDLSRIKRMLYEADYNNLGNYIFREVAK